MNQSIAVQTLQKEGEALGSTISGYSQNKLTSNSSTEILEIILHAPFIKGVAGYLDLDAYKTYTVVHIHIQCLPEEGGH